METGMRRKIVRRAAELQQKFSAGINGGNKKAPPERGFIAEQKRRLRFFAAA